MIKEAYCSFEVAKLLKEKGFDEDSYKIYRPNGRGATLGWKASNTKLSEHAFLCECISRPTHQIACAWLRQKGYHIYTVYDTTHKYWHRHIQASTGVVWSLGGLASHDEAVETALKYALECLI